MKKKSVTSRENRKIEGSTPVNGDCCSSKPKERRREKHGGNQYAERGICVSAARALLALLFQIDFFFSLSKKK